MKNLPKRSPAAPIANGANRPFTYFNPSSRGLFSKFPRMSNHRVHGLSLRTINNKVRKKVIRDPARVELALSLNGAVIAVHIYRKDKGQLTY